MDEPSNYVNFADYLGLNDEAGQQMLSKTMEGGDKLRAEAESATAARFGAAKGGSAAYEASGERERKALASYGDFMAGLTDPAKRQAMMEKAYGKGAVSALDSAFAGSAGAGRIDAAQKDVQGLRHHAEDAGIRDSGRASAADAMNAKYAQQSKDYAQRQAAGVERMRKAQADRDEELAWKQMDEYDRRSGSRGTTTWAGPAMRRGGIDPSTGKPMTAAKYKQQNPQYGWGGAGTLRDATGGGDY